MGFNCICGYSFGDGIKRCKKCGHEGNTMKNENANESSNMASQAADGAAYATANCSASWLPIETAPKDGRAVLLFGILPGSHGYSDDSLIMSVGGWSGERWGAEANNGRFVRFLEPTHWMPLPNPPNPTEQVTPARKAT